MKYVVIIIESFYHSGSSSFPSFSPFSSFGIGAFFGTGS